MTNKNQLIFTFLVLYGDDFALVISEKNIYFIFLHTGTSLQQRVLFS